MEANVIKKLRTQAGYSQEELAKKLGFSRQTLISYESGKVPSIENARKLGDFFDVDYACIVDNKMPDVPTYSIVSPIKKRTKREGLRINIPQKNIEKFKQVFLYILAKVGAKPNVGQTVLYKLLYFIDFDYYELHEDQLMGLAYIKNVYGPTPVDFAKMTKKMAHAGEIKIIERSYFDLEQTKYLPVKEADLSLLSATELAHIDYELTRLSDMSAKEISDFSHKDIPWIGAKNREVIEYDAVFYRTEETSVRKYN